MFREAEPKDAEEIGQARVTAWRAAYQQFMPEDHEQVVAFSIVGKPRYKAPAKAIELGAVNVLPKYWRMRIGSRPSFGGCAGRYA